MKVAELFRFDEYGVVVTGGASGLGLIFAEGLAGNGARVTLVDVDAARLGAEVNRLQRAGLDVRGAVADVRDSHAVDDAIDGATAAYGRLDVCFANAGITSRAGFASPHLFDRQRPVEGMLENYTDDSWREVIDVNLHGAFSTIRAATRHMRPRRSGRIVVTSSISAQRVEPHVGAAYSVSKAGLMMLVRCVALELAPFGVTVNAIAPGFFPTAFGGGLALDPKRQASMAKVIPARRVGEHADILGAALFLASPASAYVTGQQLLVDGGWSLGVAD